MSRYFVGPESWHELFYGIDRQIAYNSQDFTGLNLRYRPLTRLEGSRTVPHYELTERGRQRVTETESPRNFNDSNLLNESVITLDGLQEFNEASRKFIDSASQIPPISNKTVVKMPVASRQQDLKEISMTESDGQKRNRFNNVRDRSREHNNSLDKVIVPDQQRKSLIELNGLDISISNGPSRQNVSLAEPEEHDVNEIPRDMIATNLINQPENASEKQRELIAKVVTFDEEHDINVMRCDVTVTNLVNPPENESENQRKLSSDVITHGSRENVLIESNQQIHDKVTDNNQYQDTILQGFSNHVGHTGSNNDKHDDSDSEYGDVDDDAKEIQIGDLTLFNEFIVEEYFEKYDNQTLLNDDDDNLLEEKENNGMQDYLFFFFNIYQTQNFSFTVPSARQHAIDVDLQNGDLGFEELNTNSPPKKQNYRKAIKNSRMKGLEYTRIDGSIIPARSVKPPCSCTKYKCHEKYSEEIRQKLLSNLLKLTTSGQNQFLSNHISIRTTARPKVKIQHLNFKRKFNLIYKLSLGSVQILRNARGGWGVV